MYIAPPIPDGLDPLCPCAGRPLLFWPWVVCAWLKTQDCQIMKLSAHFGVEEKWTQLMKWSAHDLLFQLYLSSWNKLKWERNNRNIKSCNKKAQNQRYQIVIVALELYFSNTINDKRCSSWQGVEICGDWKRLKPWLESGDLGRICSFLLVNPLLQDNFSLKETFSFLSLNKIHFLTTATGQWKVRRNVASSTELWLVLVWLNIHAETIVTVFYFWQRQHC